ncbi:MAG TPA: adventurous gliding motility lipoprotein CglB [Archangium sp.]|uniref:adventurous gliding motility lipoprotein CglB n=1 Tax=Archangium sp. TaxID=1872627 RepID=UPI002EDB10B4
MSRLVRALALCLLVGGGLSTGCLLVPPEKTPDANMTVLARVEVMNRKPDLMLMVDTSGSMTFPINPSLPACRLDNGEVCGVTTPCDTSRCPTRWYAVQAAMNTFLSQNATRARLGLVTYPSAVTDSCGPSTSLRVGLPTTEDDATLVAKASEVNAAIQSIPNNGHNMPQGGTPTGPGLRFLSSIPGLQTAERDDFVLLLTDGLPNCNPDNPNAYPSTRCYCTLDNPEFCKYAPYDTLGCLDDATSVSAVQALRSQGIRTIVVGFGAEAAAFQAQVVFNNIASAGGFERQCQQDSDCGVGDTCDVASHLCRRRFYAANSGAELTSALQLIGGKLAKDSCLVQLEDSGGSPPRESLQVSVDGTVMEPGPETWSLTSEGVRFTGMACQRLNAATSTAPVIVEVRAPLQP